MGNAGFTSSLPFWILNEAQGPIFLWSFVTPFSDDSVGFQDRQRKELKALSGDPFTRKPLRESFSVFCVEVQSPVRPGDQGCC